MSDDEDELGEDGQTTGRYSARVPGWRSAIVSLGTCFDDNKLTTPYQQVVDLYKTIDACLGPAQSGRFTKRVPGPIKDDPPKSSTKLELRVRRWMVDPKWLEDNHEHDVESRIAESGKDWGDLEDPEEKVAKRLKVKEEKKMIASAKAGGVKRKRGE